MYVIKNIAVQTGNILIVKGDKGKLECLSIGDYGKEANIKADFLGISRELNGVTKRDIMPLSEKWVITISTQYGCSMGCRFCDVPNVGPGLNATFDDLVNQVDTAMSLHPEVGYTKRLNIHYARMGEPSFNRNVLFHAKALHRQNILNHSLVHPVVSTMMPKRNNDLVPFLHEWCDIKNLLYKGDAGLQISLNTTDPKQRKYQFNGSSLNLDEIAIICDDLPFPVGRKYTLNIALADETIIDAKMLCQLFASDKFMIKITPMHATASCSDNEIKTSNGYTSYVPYADIEDELKSYGFDVLVFVPSFDEEQGRITCGNAILADELMEEDHG